MNAKSLVLIGFFLLSFVAALSLGARFSGLGDSPSQIIEGLGVPFAELDMGEVWEARNIHWQLPIQNVTKYPIEIREFATSCACTEIEPNSLTIAAKQVDRVNLTLDLSGRSAGEEHVAARSFAIGINPLIEGKNYRGPAWELHGVVKSRVTLDARAVNFGERPIQYGPPVSQKIIAKVHVPCKNLEVSVKKDMLKATVTRSNNDQSRFEIVVSVEPTLEPGDFYSDLEIFVIDQTGGRTLGATLSTAGKMQPQVRILPATVIMEAKPVGSTTEAIVTLQKPSDAHIAMDHIETESAGLSVKPTMVIGIPAGHAYRIRQKIVKEGDFTSQATFVFRRNGHELVTSKVNISYRGLPTENAKAVDIQ